MSNIDQGHAAVLKKMTNEQRQMGPSDRWIKIGLGGGGGGGGGGGLLLIEHETFQSLFNLFPQKLLARGARGSKTKFANIPFFSNFRINVP
jgi:hypothetical protein